ncbi:single-stranded-DNA-specific exonuclease RecJ [Cohnella cholangitidis]|uniref:Single-stranded-DNA-specific exonuclease RecJ n=1 Tax=Cohnella cholangitidis TaxID=2598458 RepID=A0A7G5C3Q5_9BACL|nr:single-stranded-DNA-specific exonuclease RecJ [Cohnella cholangitidis]QMV43839.1 single-stranded-DNA-specific exonuclease RecJ [Cohnella cholangitidis]
MIKSKYRWDLPKLEEGITDGLAKEWKVSRIVAGVLASRGWAPSEQTTAFLRPETDHLHDPFAMKGMAAAVDRISRAIREGERIRVYGDYDADGVTSTALMIRLLTELGASFDTYIPHRSREGYGLNPGAIDLASEAGVQLLITVDNGISAVDQIAYAAEKGIEVVVTDHHEPPETLPDAIALVNPKQKDCPYPFKGLCGAGVVFKLAHAMLGRPMLEYADLAAIGTIADLMPLTGENRIIARLGLERMRRHPIAGIRALAKVAGCKTEELTSGRIGFSLAPRLNAGGRLEHADGAVKLLAATGDEEAETLAKELDRLNGERQALVDLTALEADELWQSMCAVDEGRTKKVIVLAKEGWNAGIAGLVASRLVERYYRPAIVLSMDADTGMCKGSARSIDGFDLFAALTECAGLMEHYGGHQAAAGLTISRDNVSQLADRLHDLANDWLSEEDWQPKRRVDLSIALSDATIDAVDQLAGLEPFGNGNPTPRIVIRNVNIRESRTMGKDDKHLRLTVQQGNRTMEVVAFGLGGQRERLAPGMQIDMLGELSINEWNGNRKVQAMLQDFRSDQLVLKDRRNERDSWSGVEHLVDAVPSGLAIGCATRDNYELAMSRFGPSGIPISLYDEFEIDRVAVSQTAAASERTQDSEVFTESDSGGEWRHLILLGLPSNDQGTKTLKRWLAPERGLECVTVFSGGDEIRTERPTPVPFPDRKQFGEVYSACRSKGSWLDSPDGFLQETASRSGWPLSTIRMMHEVFIELGFIAADGASRKFVPDPPRRELEESARYRKAREHATGLRLAEMSTEELRHWFSACHTASEGK